MLDDLDPQELDFGFGRMTTGEVLFAAIMVVVALSIALAIVLIGINFT